jgi:hypothetical protein
MKQSNRYILITKTGRTMVFSVQAMADLYLSIYGGNVTILQPTGQELVAKPAGACIMDSMKTKNGNKMLQVIQNELTGTFSVFEVIRTGTSVRAESLTQPMTEAEALEALEDLQIMAEGAALEQYNSQESEFDR